MLGPNSGVTYFHGTVGVRGWGRQPVWSLGGWPYSRTQGWAWGLLQGECPEGGGSSLKARLPGQGGRKEEALSSPGHTGGGVQGASDFVS